MRVYNYTMENEEIREETGKVGPYNPPVATQFKPGQSGNPNGRPKGRKNLATLVREMMEDEDFDWSLIPLSGNQREWAKKLGAPWKAIIATAANKSMMGDTRAMDFLRKSGYGDRLDVTTNGKEIQAPLLISVVQPRNVETETETIPSPRESE